MTAEQVAHLEGALLVASTSPPPRALIVAIEDAIASYQHARADSKRTDATITAWLKHYGRRKKLAEELRTELVAFPIFEGDRELVEHLEALMKHAAVWQAFFDRIPARDPHRPPDYDLAWACYAVVEALDAAHVPLTLGRNTVVVEVLILVRRWIDVLNGRDPRPHERNYDFTRDVVEEYQRNRSTPKSH